MKASLKIQMLRQEIADLTKEEREFDSNLMALHHEILNLMDNRPTTFLAGKLRDRRIRKALEVFNDGKASLVLMRTNLFALELQLKVAVDHSQTS